MDSLSSWGQDGVPLLAPDGALLLEVHGRPQLRFVTRPHLVGVEAAHACLLGPRPYAYTELGDLPVRKTHWDLPPQPRWEQIQSLLQDHAQRPNRMAELLVSLCMDLTDTLEEIHFSRDGTTWSINDEMGFPHRTVPENPLVIQLSRQVVHADAQGRLETLHDRSWLPSITLPPTHHARLAWRHRFGAPRHHLQQLLHHWLGIPR